MNEKYKEFLRGAVEELQEMFDADPEFYKSFRGPGDGIRSAQIVAIVDWTLRCLATYHHKATGERIPVPPVAFDPRVN